VVEPAPEAARQTIGVLQTTRFPIRCQLGSCLAVNFQEVVHSVPTGKAEGVEASAIRRTE
jgi:hypothetical protein